MDTDYSNGSDGQDNAGSEGGSTRRMDMTDMADDSAIGESSADAVSAAEAGTDATVNQGSGAEDYPAASNSATDSAAQGDSVAGADHDTGGGNSAGSSSTTSAGGHSGRIPDYALQMVAASLHKKGHQVSSGDLDAALDEAGFTITPDPWHNYSQRPTPAAGAVQQREAEQQGGFVSAAPVGSAGAFVIPDKAAAASEPAAAPIDNALSQLQADEAQTVSPSGSADQVAPVAPPAPSSGLEMAQPAAPTDTAAGPAAGMSDTAVAEQPTPMSEVSLPDAATAEEPLIQNETSSSAAAGNQGADVAATPASESDSGAISPDVTYGTNLPMDGETYPAQTASATGAEQSGAAAPTDATTAPQTAGTGEFAPSADTIQTIPDTSYSQSPAQGGNDQPAMQGMGPLMQGGAAPQPAPPQMQPVANTVTVASQVGQQLAPHISLGNGVEFALSDKDEILIGREDPVSDIFPDVDLTNFGGEEGGVSRRHARIIRDGDTYLLEDLNSTNYTKLNGVKLIPKIPQAMRDGDHLSFGKVEASFHLYK